MKRLTRSVVAASLTVSALALAGAALHVAGTPGYLQSAVTRGPSLADSLVLLRWGYGALDGLAPEATGDRNDRNQHRRR